MTRLRKGRNFEEALKHWTDPGIYETLIDDEPGRVRSPIEVFYLERTGVDLGLLAHLNNLKHLDALLFRRLAEGMLFSSATDESDDPSHPRSLVHPSLYEVDGVVYDRFRRAVIAGRRTLWNVEIFGTDEIPTNVTRLPDWLSQYSDKLADSTPPLSGAAAGSPAFHHDPDFRHVTLRGREFSLSPTQAGVVEVLHEAWVGGTPWKHLEDLRGIVGFETAKLGSIFRRVKAWRDLIASDKRGFYRLNL